MNHEFSRAFAAFAIAVLFSFTTTFAQQSEERSAAEVTVPRLINLSGVLRHKNGQPLSGVVGLRFSLYKDQQGGAPLWTENQNVFVDEQGRYSVLLGTTKGDGLPIELFTTAESRWLGVQAQGPGEEEQPRILLVSVPYALKAADAETLGGKPLSAFVLAPESTDEKIQKSDLAKDSSTTSNLSGTGTTNQIVKWTDGATGALGDSTITESGSNIGIGTAAPLTRLDVAGASRVTGLTIPSAGAGLESYYNGVGGLLAYDRGASTYKELRLEGSPFTLYNAGTEGMRLHTNNYVGVGTTNPGTRLDVSGSTRVSGLTVPSAGAGLETYYNGFGGLLAYDRSASSYKELRLEGSPFTFYNAGNEAMRVHTNGNVGIGTTNPGAKLDVAGDVKVSGTIRGALVGGFSGNAITVGVNGGTISGGGAETNTNRVTDDFGTVSGGANNQAGDNAGVTLDRPYGTVAGGQNNTASGSYSTVGGGAFNTASGSFSATVAGGSGNTASGSNSAVAGGSSNHAVGQYAFIGAGTANFASGSTAVIGGGQFNSATGNGAVIAGGSSNGASGSFATVSGGSGNQANAPKATIGGGGLTDDFNLATGNRVTDDFGTVSGGGNNQAGNNTAPSSDSAYATVSGGQGNTASGFSSTVGGGTFNTASGFSSTVGGGASNNASGAFAVVGAGTANFAGGSSAVVGGGQFNSASGPVSVVAGGSDNVASGLWATVPGGAQNTAAGSASFAAGTRAKANHPGAFVWGDSTNADVVSTGNDTFVARASGGVTFYTNSTATTGVTVATGSGSWSSLSDRSAKENFQSVDGRTLLKKLDAIPIEVWNYKSQNDSIRHVGPMAQDFRSAFGLGEDDTHISAVDADGVALATIQTLYRMLLEKEKQIEELGTRIRQLEAGLEEIRSESPTNGERGH